MFAVTPRLLLRPGWPEDAAAIAKAIADEAIIRNLASAPWPYTISDAQNFLALSRPAIHPNFLIFSRNRLAPEFVGSIGFGFMENDTLELGYWIARQHWGQGYATEAGKAVLDIARSLGHREIQAEYFMDNPASGRVLAKLGFYKTGRIEQRYSMGRKSNADAIQLALDLEEGDEKPDVMRPLAA